MSLEEHSLEAVVDVFGRIVLVGNDFVQHDAPFGFDFVVGESGFRRQFEEQAGGLPEIFLQHGGVQDDLLLGGVGVQFTAQPVQVAGDDRGALARGAPEHRMFHEMGDAAPEIALVPRPAADAQGAVTDGGSAAPDGIPESARCCSAAHYRPLDILRRSSVRKPAAFRALTLCLRI